MFSLTAPHPLRLPLQALYQPSKFDKIGDAQARPPAAKDTLGVPGNDVGPLAWHRAHSVSVDAEQKPHAVTVVPLSNAHPFPPA